MAFQLYYNQNFPLRTINIAKKYLDAGGTIGTENKAIHQMSKLQVIDYFFPSLFVKELSGEDTEAVYDYESCYILAPRKQGSLSNWGSYKQKINNIEDSLLGNSKNEQTYKNYIAAQNMQRRAASDLMTKTELRNMIVSNLQMIYENRLNADQKHDIDHWLGSIKNQFSDKNFIRICTAQRIDGFSYSDNVYHALTERISSLYDSQNYSSCWAWFCLGTILGNYIEPILNHYDEDFSSVSPDISHPDEYRLISSPSVIVKPYFCGRDSELKQIDDMFSAGNRVIFLYGIGGIGKSEIAKQYALKYRNQYDVIIYAVYESSLKDLIIQDTPFELTPPLERLTVNEKKEDDDTFFRRKLDILKRSAAPRTLIIIDNYNAENDDVLTDLIYSRYHLLITTQYDYSHNYAAVRIGEISEMKSLIDIFMNNYHGYAVERDDPDLISLIRSVDCHTFTVVLLARHMENSGQSAAEMLEALDREGIQSLNEKVAIGTNDPDTAYLKLIQMFKVFDFNEEEQYVLQLLSILPYRGIPAMVFKTWAGLTSTRTLLTLEKRGWITRNIGGIALHPVVKRVVKYMLPVKAENIRTFLDNAAETLASENSWHLTKEQKEQYSGIAGSIIQALRIIDDNTVRFYRSAAVLFGYSDYPEKAIELDIKLYQYSLKHDDHAYLELAYAAYRTGWAYLFNLQLKDALTNAEIWLSRGREYFERAELQTVQQKSVYCGLLENLSKSYSLRYEETGDPLYLRNAEKYARQAVFHSKEWLLGYKETKKSPAGSLLRLADVYISLEKYEAADELINEAYGILSTIYEDHDHKNPDILRATSRKARTLYCLGKYNESLAETELNLAAYREFYNKATPTYFDQMVLKIQNCIRLGLADTARETKKEALTAGRKIYSADSPKMQMLSNLI